MKEKRSKKQIKSIWNSFYWADYAADTGHLTQGEHGAYFLLLKRYYLQGGRLENGKCYAFARAHTDEERKNVDTILTEFFRKDGDFWINLRAEEEIKETKSLIKTRSSAGKQGAQARWQTDGKRMREPMAKPKQKVWQNDAQSQPQSQYKNYISSYEDIVGRKLVNFSEKRKTSLKVLISKGTIKSPEHWQEILQRVKASNFLQIKWTKWGIDWLLNETNLTKIQEGNYDNDRETTGTGAKTSHRRSHSEILADQLARGNEQIDRNAAAKTAQPERDTAA